MKVLNLFLGVAIISNVAIGEEFPIALTGRVGFNQKSSNSNFNSSSFGFDFLRSSWAGNVNKELSFSMSLDFLGATGNDSVDGTPNLVDEAFLSYDLSGLFKLHIGKKAVFIGGREYAYLNTERYSLSMFNQATPGNQVGATIEHNVFGQKFVLQAFNGNKENSNSGKNAQSKMGYSVGMEGDFLDGKIKPILGYTVIPKSYNANAIAGNTTVRANNGNDELISFGSQFNILSNIIFEMDYNILNEKKVTASEETQKINSIVSSLRWNFENWSVFAKYFDEYYKLQNVKISKFNTYEAGVEFKQFENQLKYHLVYAQKSTQNNYNTVNLSKETERFIYAGLTFSPKF